VNHGHLPRALDFLVERAVSLAWLYHHDLPSILSLGVAELDHKKLDFGGGAGNIALLRVRGFTAGVIDLAWTGLERKRATNCALSVASGTVRDGTHQTESGVGRLEHEYVNSGYFFSLEQASHMRTASTLVRLALS
jgi:hypothetical protein